MKLRLLFLFIIISQIIVAQNTNDSLQTEPTSIPIDYATPSVYEIADIKIEGADSYEDYVLIGFSGLKVGQRINIPGEEITNAVKRFWKQSLFSSVKIFATKTENNKIWLTIQLKQNPRVGGINFTGFKKSEIEDLEPKITIAKGQQITTDIIERSKQTIKKYYLDKGFFNAEVKIRQKDAPDMQGTTIVDILVNRKEKVRVNEIYVTGNKALSLNKIDRAMKKTNRAGKIANIFRAKKFVQKEYENDKKVLIEKYNEIGYRDAAILRDSVVKRDDGTVDVYIELEEGKKYSVRIKSHKNCDLYGVIENELT